jgi:5-methylcytosine-specific restriction endonuclease McrA
VKENRLEYKCANCGIKEWNNLPLSLQLDHINGVNNDHRLENLRFLCPNCHSQTDTYSGKNK